MRWLRKPIHPKLELSTNQTERMLDILALALLLALLGVAAYYHPILPEKIPTHFGVDGRVDRFGSKNMVFALPCIALVMGIFLQIAAQFPHRFNYIQKITPENMERQYRGGRLLLRLLRLEIFALFLYLNWAIAESAVSGEQKVNMMFALLFVVLVPISILGVLMKAR